MKLHTEIIAREEPEQFAFVLHGVFGSGANFRLFMRNLAKERPDWGFVLVDLRGHAGSLGAAPPHSIEAMASDLDQTERALGLPIRGVVGHSLGGKVALAYAELRRGELDQVWSLDSQPGTRDASDGSTTDVVLELLEALPARFPSRQAFADAVVAAGQPKAIASWLAMNVERDGDGWRLSLDLPAIRQILDDYWARDLWPELAATDSRRALHVVMGGASFVWREGDRGRLEALAAQERLELHVFEGAGHWIHVEAGEALRKLMRERL